MSLLGANLGAKEAPRVAGAAWAACLDNQVVLAATCAASLKLVLICTGVGWLLRSGRIPNDTAPVLSKVHIVQL